MEANGELQNQKDVLSETQQKRFEQAKTSITPDEILTQADSEAAEKGSAA